jgi:YidC/Oxa1 family membrane protein insertase
VISLGSYSSRRFSSAIYTGPKDHYLLTQSSAQLQQALARKDIDLEGLIDYGWFSWMSRPLAVPILSSIKWLQRLTGSYGVAIILFTIVIYSLFFPLKWRSSKSMKKAQKLAPRMKELQEKIKGMKQNDPRLKELQVEQLRLMKEGNPLGGCLPLLIQMPFLFALYRAITISLDFRQASFLVAARPFRAGTLSYPRPADPDGGHHDRFAINYPGAVSGSVATKNDGSGHALVYAVHSLERALWFVTLLAGRKHCGICAAVRY